MSASLTSQELPTDEGLQPTLVRASAGTGKTYQLTARLLKILLQGAAPETILATTFTRKAAGEILQRILSDLALAADPEDPEALEALRAQVGIPGLPASVVADLVASLMRQIHRLRICTLDSLFSQLARSFPFELDLPPAWRLTDEIEEVWFRERAVNRVLGDLEPGETATMLSMLAKGETKRSVSREIMSVVSAAYSASRLSSPDAWLQLAAPRAPDDQRREEIAGRFRAAAAETKLKRHQTKLNQLADWLDTAEVELWGREKLIPKIAEARRTGQSLQHYGKPFDRSTDEGFDFLYQQAQCQTLGLLSGQNEATGSVLARYDQQIRGIKQNARALGFEDIAIRLAEVFGRLDVSMLSSRMDGSVDHLLLDEFQDTSPVQWQVLRPMAHHSATPVVGEGREDWQAKRSFFCVGDTKQAIYGWRGGVAEIFDAVASQIDGVTEKTQNKSYRSSPAVIETVNEIFKNLDRHPMASVTDDPTTKTHYESAAVRAFTRRFPTHETAKSELPGSVVFCTSPMPVSNQVDDRRSAVYDHAAAKIVDGIQANPGQSVGVLTRTNPAVFQMILRLERLGVEVSQEGGNPLVDSAAVEVVLSALMSAEHPGDGRWAFHTSNTPLAQSAGWTGQRIRRMVHDLGIAETVESMAADLAPICDDRDTVRLKQLISLAIAYQANESNRLRDFVRLVREKRVQRPKAAPVRVMTIHQSKGLEFDHVVLPQIDGELVRASADVITDQPDLSQPPASMTRYLRKDDWHFLSDRWLRVFGDDAAGKMTEALCLMYVAITRARRGLTMISPPNARLTGNEKTMAGLLYHSLRCTADPSEPETILYEHRMA